MNINDIITESQQACPHCGGPLVEYSGLMEKKDACYYKVKASAKVWPSAYASGRLVQCRKKGSANYGNKSEGVAEGSLEEIDRRGFLKGAGAAAVAGAAGAGGKVGYDNYNASRWNKSDQDYDELDQEHKRKGFSLPSTDGKMSLLVEPNNNTVYLFVKDNSIMLNSFSQLRMKIDNNPAETIDNILGGGAGFHFSYPTSKVMNAGKILFQVAFLKKGETGRDPQKQDYKIITFMPGQQKESVEQGVAEGNGAAQQAAIAIAKRESGKYSKKDGHRLKEDDTVAEGAEQEILFYAKIPDGSRVYARVKDEEQIARLQQQYRAAEIKTFDFRRPDILDWLEARGINLRKFAPGMVQTMYPGSRGHNESKGLNEFAMSGSDDDGNDGFSDDTLKQLAAQWYNGDEDPRVESTLMAAGWEIGQDEGYDDTPGVFVVQAGDINGNSYISWPAHELEALSEAVDPEIEEMYEAMEQLAEEMAAKKGVSVDLVWESFEALDDHMLYETAAWRRKEGKSAKGGLNAKGVASYRRENPGSKLQMAVTTKPSKLKPGSKAAKRRKSFCARMGGVKGPMKKPNGKPTRKALALRKWNC